MKKLSTRSIIPAAILFVIGAGIHIPFISPEPIWDDGAFLAGNAFLGDCSGAAAAVSPGSFLSVERRPLAARPLTLATLAADACQGGDFAWLKLTNALLHGLNAALLFFYVSAAAGSGTAAFLAAALFALHPAAGEAVHIAVFRNHLLSFLFVFCALALLLDEKASGRWKREAGALACLAAALLSGETAAAFPFMLLCQWAAMGGPLLDRRRLRFLAAAGAVLLFYLWFRLPRSGYILPGSEPLAAGLLSPLYPAAMFPSSGAACYVPPHWVPPWAAVYADYAARFYTMSSIMLAYIGDLLLPVSLKGDYSPAVINSAAAGLPRAALLTAVLAAPAAMLASARWRATGAALLMAAAAFLPVSGIFPVYNLRADRYLYLPMGAVSLVWAAAAAAGPARLRGPIKAFLAALCAAFALFSLQRLPDFSSARGFFETAAEGGDNARAEINLAAVAAAEGGYKEAARGLRRALEIYPSDPHAVLRLAEVSLDLRRPEEAVRILEAGLPDGYGPAAAYLEGVAAWQKGLPGKAAVIFKKAEKEAGGCFRQAEIAGEAAAFTAGRSGSIELEGIRACMAPSLLRRLDSLGARPSPAGLAEKIEEKNLSGPCRNW